MHSSESPCSEQVIEYFTVPSKVFIYTNTLLKLLAISVSH